jgi:non-ribosomal peptide synthetase component F
VVFENYPTDALGHRIGGLRVGRVRFVDPSHYPLTLTAALDPDFQLRINYDRRRFLAGRIDRLLAGLEILLDAMAAEPDVRVGSLLDRLAEAEQRQAEARERELEAESRSRLQRVRRRTAAER